MKVSLNWLKEYINVTLSSADVANLLTMAGSEVKGTQTLGGEWENVVIGRIIEIAPHPNADRLTLPTIDLGTEKQTVVCGAPNLKVGDKVVFARVGARLTDPHTGEKITLKTAKIRGVVSSGMVCSEKELGISENHEGIMVLPLDAPLGTPLADYLGDTIFDLDVTPNRPDCLSVIGIAHELAALTRQNLHPPAIEYKEGTSPIEQQIAIEILAPELCPRYCASLITGVKLGESPTWMQHRLQACGMRPINNIVDVTNYVMLEYGQPLHSFDYKQIRGKKIVVRRARDGEVITSLDSVERTLSHNTLVIADGERAVAIAGVMGGANSEVTEQTTSILLEAANFNPASIHYTGRSLSLPSEACMRFERGIRPELALPALKRATQLIIQLGGGEAAKGIVDVYPGKQEAKPILLTTEKVKRVLGVEFNLNQIVETLTSLGFDCQSRQASQVEVTAPYWRSDIHQAVDLVEEVARIAGYDKIPTTMLSQSIPRQNPTPTLTLKRRVRQTMAGLGFQEVITYSLTGRDMLSKLQSSPAEDRILRMSNPMTTEQEYLRPHLRANLLATLSSNRRHEDGGIKLFELGKVFISRPKDLPDEREVLCGILSGLRIERSWLGDDKSLDFYDTKGIVESLLSQMGVEASFKACADGSFHPSKQATIIIGGNTLGVLGELHPRVLEAFDITSPAYLFEIDLTALLPSATGDKKFQPIPRFPTMARDMALVVNSETTHQNIMDIINGFPLVTQITVFDVYSGEQVPPGKKSLAYSITFQSPTHTLTDDEVNKVMQQILDRLSRELGATLRS
jgi:phenylalanyl-tRNA synthetase beta chain